MGFVFTFFSCGDLFELDLQENPNNPTPETADIESLFNSVQGGFVGVLENTQFFTMQLSRQRALTAGGIYVTAFSPQNFDGLWRSAYSGFLPDADAVIELGESTGQLFHVGATKIMKGYVLMTLVDMFGNVPFTAAGQGSADLGPASDSGSDVYAAAEALISEGISDLEANTAPGPALDNYYGGSAADWTAAGNSILLRSAVNKGDQATFNQLITDGGLITASSDFQFQYGSNRDNPDSRHPLYVNSYEVDDGHYQSNWLMYVMQRKYGATDPRIRAYYFRQVSTVPLDNDNRFDCIFSIGPDPTATPTWFTACDEDMPYCVGDLEAGYYGRDHGNGNGIPPDGDIRAVYGVYPAGGKFDNNSFGRTNNNGTDGGLGAGIHPIFPSFFIDFYEAEMAIKAGDEAAAKTHLADGMAASIAKVKSFISAADPNSLEEVVATNPVVVTGADFVPSAADDSTYMAQVMQAYDEAGDKMEVIGTQFLIASYGNGLAAYNWMRRTASPQEVQPPIEQGAGAWPRSAFYPAVHVNLNQNVSQKSITEQVFWDTNPAELGPCY